ncbi:MAG: hypothetical protein R3B90_20915 [Planctomycetaceae bacterium]
MSVSFEDLSPQNFSFNSPLGWCAACDGLGVEQGTNQQALIGSPQQSLAEGAVTAWPDPKRNPEFRRWLDALAAEFAIPLDVPWYQLDPRLQRVVLYGSDRWVNCPASDDQPGYEFQYKGLYPAIEEATRLSFEYRMKFQDLVGEQPCSVCGGDRIRPDAAAVRLEQMTLPQLTRLPLDETLSFLDSLKLTKEQQKIAGDLLNEARHRLRFLIDVGLDYLTLDRSMPTLSGGESQRIRLAGQIGRALTGVLYVLDEPTIGLHPRDNSRLIEALHRLRDLGNTVVLVEHDQEVLESADRLYDFGPGSGRFGGTVTASGTPADIASDAEHSLTGAYLSGRQSIPIPKVRRMTRRDETANDGGKHKSAAGAPFAETHDPPPGGAWLELTNCRLHNLRGVDLHVPLGTFTCVTGLSGSGKSSLIQETLARAVARHLGRGGDAPGPFAELRGAEQISRVIEVDQAPLGATPASNPATYTGVFDPIRDLFSKLPDAKVRGFKPGRFSFNRAGGRCEDCEGLGQKKIEMHFLPDVWVTCDTCRGKRYNEETLAVKYKGRSISEVLDLSIGQGLELFGNIPKIRAPLATLAAIGLDYLTLGQSATTLSGGEAQRVKLAAELCKPNSGRTLYLLDEPTTGLHFDDIAKLLKVLGSLVEQGNTVVVIEHNLDVIKTADWVIDVGPEAGIGGGYIVVEGTPEDVVEYAASVAPGASSVGSRSQKGQRGRSSKSSLGDQLSTLNPTPAKNRSYTGELLAPVLAAGKREDLDLFDVSAGLNKRKGDVEISKVGKEAALPWKVDGRKWHAQDRPARNGKPCQWEGAALEFVVDLIEEYDGLQEANWGDPSTVEITAVKKTGTGWFFHALTGDEWFVRFYFRVPKGTFDEEQLAESLDLTPVDELDDIPVYGRGERVKFNNTKGPFQEVMIDVHSLDDINTDAFREFIEEAIAHYVEKAEEQHASPIDQVMPWKVLGKKWHLARKGFPSNKRIDWSATVLEQLLDVVEPTLQGLTVDWTSKTLISWKNSQGVTVAEIQTKRREGLFLTLVTEPGKVALGQIAQLGSDRDISPHRSGKEAVKVQFNATDDVDGTAIHSLIKGALGT